MNENSKATQTWGTVDWVNLAPSHKGWKFLSLANIALLAYRFLVFAGIIITIVIMLNLDHKQLRIFNVMMSRHDRHSQITNGSNPLATVIPYDGWLRQDLNREYVVRNPSCEIPNYPEFHRDVKPYVRREKEVNCSSKPQLTSVISLARNSSYVLNLHKTRVSQYEVTSADDVVCCYTVFYFLTNNDSSSIDECIIFDSNVILNSSAEFVRITCKDNLTVIYDAEHLLVPVKPKVLRKMKQIDRSNDTDDLSVMIIGLESVSRLNLLRTMPETVKYLGRNGWYALKGYHRIEKAGYHSHYGPAFTGLTANQLEGACGYREKSHSCPWIWKSFSNSKYITAYGEDDPEFNAFSKFIQPNTDYFVRIRENSEDSYPKKQSECYPKCRDPKKQAYRILDFATDFASRFVNYPTFSLFWVSSVGAGDINCPAMVDGKFISYLTALNRSGALNRTMVVFMSDHGYQKWDFRRTNMGFMEDNLPFVYIWLPAWYTARYPNKAKNLARNKHMLTSQFDFHLTLMDVLGRQTKAESCPGCVSLFDPVPWNRGCADAGISDVSCSCTKYEEIPTDSTVVKKMALIVEANLNDIVAKYSNHIEEGFTCSRLGIRRIISARRQAITNPIPNGQLYLIQVVTSPGNSTTEAIIQLTSLEVLSLTNYTPDDILSFCMKAREAKPWCACRKVTY